MLNHKLRNLQRFLQDASDTAFEFASLKSEYTAIPTTYDEHFQTVLSARKIELSEILYELFFEEFVLLKRPQYESVDWIPKVNEDGSISYIAEDGDNASTLENQYGLNTKVAEQLYSNANNKFEITGQEVKDVTGNEVLKFNIASKTFTKQRFLDQIIFARNHITSTETELWKTTDYFTNTGAFDDDIMRRREISGYGFLRIGKDNIKIHFQIPIYRFELHRTTPVKYPTFVDKIIYNRHGTYFKNSFSQTSIEFYGRHPETNNKFRLNPISFWFDSKYFNKIYQYFDKVYPKHTYNE